MSEKKSIRTIYNQIRAKDGANLRKFGYAMPALGYIATTSAIVVAGPALVGCYIPSYLYYRHIKKESRDFDRENTSKKLINETTLRNVPYELDSNILKHERVEDLAYYTLNGSQSSAFRKSSCKADSLQQKFEAAKNEKTRDKIQRKLDCEKQFRADILSSINVKREPYKPK